MNKKQRHFGRVLSLLWLYQIDIGKMPLEMAMSEIPDELTDIDQEGRDFAALLTRGVWSQRQRFDEITTRYAKGWSLSRMAAVERNVLRIAFYELTECSDIPTSVTVNEAVDIAKRYGDADSGKFVNGILGAYIRGEYEPPAMA